MNFIKVTQIIAVSIAFCSFSFGQVGVNTPNPNSSAALEVVSPSVSDNRGVLLPRMTTAQMNTIDTNSTTVGLMVFNTDDRLFYYHDGTAWIGLVPKQPSVSYPTNPTINGHIVVDNGSIRTPKLNADTVVSSRATIDTLTQVNVPGFSHNALVPSGAIIMWSGSTPPTGWALCDGQSYYSNGAPFDPFGPVWPVWITGPHPTPDLRGRFIVGFDPSASTTPTIAANNGTEINYGAVGNIGGENGHLLTSGESGLPAHIHPSTSHYHDVLNVAQNTNDVDSGNDSSPIAAANETNVNFSTTSATVTTPLSTAQDASVVHENRPPYYVLAYIIKLP